MSDSAYCGLSEKSCKQCDVSNGLFERFAEMQKKQILTDIILTSSDGKRFHVHELIMAGVSDYFYERLNISDINENKDNTSGFVPLGDPFHLDIHSSILDAIITFCYTGNSIVTVDNINSVLAAAGLLKIQQLLTMCCSALDKVLTPANCLQYLQIAKEHNMLDLIDKALELIAENLIDVCKTKDFHRLSIPQMNWLLRNLSKTQNGLYDDLLKSLKRSESEFVTTMPQLFTGSETLSIVRSAFIVGYFKGLQNSNLNGTVASSNRSIGMIGRNYFDNSNKNENIASDGLEECDDEYDDGYGDENLTVNDAALEIAKVAEQKASGIVVHMNKREIQFSTFCGMQHEWNVWPKKITVPHDIDTYKNTIIHPIDGYLYIFYMNNSRISIVQQIEWETSIITDVPVPNDVKNFAAALFCLLNDEIYCFTRNEQNSFYKLNTKTNQWTFELIENAMDCKCMIGLNDELYFIGCGYHRTIVRSYNVLTQKWTARGGLKRSTQEDAIKAATVNESIYVVLKCYDHTKIYNQTEFLVQTYDVEGNDWMAVKQIYTTHFIDRFYLHAAGYFLYLFHENGKVHVYNERAVEWSELPDMKIALPVSAICITERNEQETF